ncbi:hypothetical protein NT6N_08400 [Oceaniferula spumae]|uniref:asparagine synthase (glutamine-hydrolyzing) n=1 Tax=Oceaniferula spumae TaxID=2979115 RepID=A0AAT9FIH0_9BACT
MPSFVFFSDREPNRAESTKRKQVQCIVPTGFERVRGEVESQHSTLRWHCGEQVPVEVHQSTGSGFAFLMGEAIAEDSDDYITAEELFRMVREKKEDAAVQLSRLSGLFAWIVVLDDESVHCGCDPFGVFPVYYFQEKDTFAISTSPKAFHAFPEYDRSLDPIGFSRYLLENGCSSHRTLEKSGKRLNMAESISYSPITGSLRKTQHDYPGKDVVKDVHTLADAVELSSQASRQAVKRHAQRSVTSCMLSGGLDSRHVLSLAHELGHQPKCVTFGTRTSEENICAGKVAGRLNLEWECSELFEGAPEIALDDELNLFSLGGGFNGVSHWWGKAESIEGTRCLKGLYLDVTYAPFAREHGDLTFGSYRFAQETWLHSFGVRASELADLYKDKELIEGLDAALSECRAEWDALTEDSCERQWQTISRYRGRAHLGGILWKNAFHHWPITPALDVPLTEAIRRVDGQLIANRVLQKETFKALRPDLAAIPLAAVKSSPRPLIETWKSGYYRRMFKLLRKGRKFKEKRLQFLGTPDDAKIQCWKEARRRTVEHLEQGSELFHADKTKASVSDLYASGERVKWTRKMYSQRMLVGGISWLASREGDR